MESRSSVIPWSDLPKEVVERIGNCLNTYIDVLRFRAVCTTWRSSLPPFRNSPPLPLQLPFPNIEPDDIEERNELYLIESTIYLFQPRDGASIASSCRGWLVKVTQTEDGELRVMNPVADNCIYNFYRDDRIIRQVLPECMPKVLNLLDFRVSQVSKAYHLQCVRRSCPSYKVYDHVGYLSIKILLGYLCSKILLSANHARSRDQTNHFSIMAIVHTGELIYLNAGDDKWTELKNDSCYIVDIILYKGNFYAVDQYGKTTKFDSSFNETVVSSILYDGGSKKRLVESSGELFLVDIVLDNKADHPDMHRALEIKIYRLDEEKHVWIAVSTLGDRIFFAGDDCCFSVSSYDFGDYCRGNCIYFANIGTPMDFGPVVGEGKIWNFSESGGLSKELVRRYEGLHHNTGVFTVEDGKLGSLLSCLEYADIFWPPPSWLNQARSDALDAITSASWMTQTLGEELADVKRKLLDLAFSGSNFKSTNPLLEASLDPTKELSRLLMEQKYEEAFTAALQRSGVSNIVPWLCSQVDLPGILSMNPLPLSEGVLVSLLKQLASDVSRETSPRLSWMRNVLSAINSSSF